MTERSIRKDTKTRGGGFKTNLRLCRPRIELIVALAWFLFTVNAAADNQSDRVDRIKAAFVLNIARFVSWPPEAFESKDEHLLLCLYRSNPIHQAVDLIQGEMVSGRHVSIARVDSLTENDSCHILLIAHNELQSYLKEARFGPAIPLLTIADLTESDTLLHAGSDIMIGLVRNDTRIGFAINLTRSRQAGLKMSSQLLKLATIVDDAP
ncbi:YfiR family protein [Methylotuvimicrobium sp. KM2]|uniref:YfiR family protein n=1 Tax=Methylotuvimicrobium sp. KM2 TaxID=3133976 RepID=UPI003100E5AF